MKATRQQPNLPAPGAQYWNEGSGLTAPTRGGPGPQCLTADLQPKLIDCGLSRLLSEQQVGPRWDLGGTLMGARGIWVAWELLPKLIDCGLDDQAAVGSRWDLSGT